MRALLIMLALVVVGVGGFLVYRQNAPAPTAPAATEPQQSSYLSSAADCTASNARYTFRGDPRLLLRFVDDPQMGALSVPLVLQLTITAKQETHLFRVYVEEPGYQRNMLTPIVNGAERPLSAGNRIQVAFFDDGLAPVAGAPHPSDVAPGYIFAPEMMRYIYNLSTDRRVDSPAGVFVFQACDTPPSAPAAQ